MMQAAVLVKNASPEKAFQIREMPEPDIFVGGVKIKVEAFGLNFADVMARLGLYQECPPLPTILGYDVVGSVVEVSKEVTDIKIGDRVVALTRFGGYAQYVVADARACAIVVTAYDTTKATALSTQYCTAWFCMQEMVHLHEGDSILIHAAAGGVGTAMVQLALHKKYKVYATAGSKEKVEALRKSGVHLSINYNTTNYEAEIRRLSNSSSPLDAIFNSVGGKTVKQDLRLLNAGGREVLYGAAQFSSASLLGKIKTAFDFGFYHPLQFMMKSKSLIGINMLQIADNKPEMVSHCLKQVIKLAQENILDPHVGGYFSIKELAKAHRLLEARETMGKIAVYW